MGWFKFEKAYNMKDIAREYEAPLEAMEAWLGDYIEFPIWQPVGDILEEKPEEFDRLMILEPILVTVDRHIYHESMVAYVKRVNGRVAYMREKDFDKLW